MTDNKSDLKEFDLTDGDELLKLEGFDTSDLGDVHVDDSEIEQWERELGLLPDESPASEPTTQAVEETPLKAEEPKVEEIKDTKDDGDTAQKINEAANQDLGKKGSTLSKEASQATNTEKTAIEKVDQPASQGLDKNEKSPKAATETKAYGQRSGYRRTQGYRRAPMNAYMANTNMPMAGYIPYYHYPFAPAQMPTFQHQPGARIYINPNFAPSMQNAPSTQRADQQEEAVLSPEQQAEIQRLRKEILETRRRREAEKARSNADNGKNAKTIGVAGQKRSSGDEATETRAGKRLNSTTSIRGISSASTTALYKGITIKGAAAAAAAAVAVNKELETTQDTQIAASEPSRASSSHVFSRLNKGSAPSSPAMPLNTHTTRESKPQQLLNLLVSGRGVKRSAATQESHSPVHTAKSSEAERPAKRPNTIEHPHTPRSFGAEQSAKSASATEHAIPINTTGKSSTLIIKNITENITEKDLINLGKNVRGGIVNLEMDRSEEKATASFENAEAAIIFRRKYNRFRLDGKNIIISFA